MRLRATSPCIADAMSSCTRWAQNMKTNCFTLLPCRTPLCQQTCPGWTWCRGPMGLPQHITPVGGTCTMTWRQPNTSSLSQAGVSGQSLSEIMNENHHKIPFQSKFCFFDCSNYIVHGQASPRSRSGRDLRRHSWRTLVQESWSRGESESDGLEWDV